MARDKRALKKKGEQWRRRQLQSMGGQMRAAARWPIDRCLVSDTWREQGALVTVILTRSRVPGDANVPLAMASYLVDLGCLGLKDTFGRTTSPVEFREQMQRSPARLVAVDAGLGAMVVQEGIAYARGLGFEPHADYRHTAAMLEGVAPADRAGELKLGGRDGKPLFVAGPNDDARKVVNQLTARLGPEGFQFVSPM